MMDECSEACIAASNQDVLILVRKVQAMLEMWERCILSRLPGEHASWLGEEKGGRKKGSGLID